MKGKRNKKETFGKFMDLFIVIMISFFIFALGMIVVIVGLPNICIQPEMYSSEVIKQAKIWLCLLIFLIPFLIYIRHFLNNGEKDEREIL